MLNFIQHLFLIFQCIGAYFLFGLGMLYIASIMSHEPEYEQEQKRASWGFTTTRLRFKH